MKLKKIIALFLCLCLASGGAALLSFGAIGAEEDTVVIFLEEGDYLGIYQDGYRLGKDADSNLGEKITFSGTYVLTGSGNGEIDFMESGEYDVILHDFTMTGKAWASVMDIRGVGTTLNLTARGINKLIADSHPGLIYQPLEGSTGENPIVRLTVDKNSSIEFGKGSQGNGTGVDCIDARIDFKMSDNSAVSGTEAADWRKSNLTVSSGTPANHNLTFAGEGFKYVCGACDVIVLHKEHIAGECVEAGSEYHEIVCSICKEVFDKDHHYFTDFESNGESGHSATCGDCGYEVENMKHYYCYYSDSGIHVLYCYYCDYWIEEEHTFTEAMPANADYLSNQTIKICEKCGYFHGIDLSESAVMSVYINSDEGALLVYRNGEPWTVLQNELHYLPYDEDSSYVFKSTYLLDAEILLPGEEPYSFNDSTNNNYAYRTLLSLNVADYSAVDEALDGVSKILDSVVGPTAELEALKAAISGVKRMLPVSEQDAVDKMAEDINNAVANLTAKSLEPGVSGFINAGAMLYDRIVITEDGYRMTMDGEEGDFVSYTGDYTFWSHKNVWETDEETPLVPFEIIVESGKHSIEMINVGIGSLDESGESALTVFEGAEANLTFTGTNAICYNYYYGDQAGIKVNDGATLTINDSQGDVFAAGGNDSAGIGGSDEEDCGKIVIDGSTVFAVSNDDSAGIGGSDGGSVDEIIINGGRIYAANIDSDGAGIGAGEGSGDYNKITINGGYIIAYSEDDSAAIGGQDSTYFDEITINGGTLLLGSKEGSGIGGGNDADYCGKITINGGVIAAHPIYGVDYYSVDYYLIGNGGEEGEDNLIRINGGNIITHYTHGISPAPKNDAGEPVYQNFFTVDKAQANKEVTYRFNNGSTRTVTAYGTKVELYLPEGVEEFVSADYSAVHAAIIRANKLNRNDYSNFEIVDEVLAAIEWDKSSEEQAEVDQMAADINEALDNLEEVCFFVKIKVIMLSIFNWFIEFVKSCKVWLIECPQAIAAWFSALV